MVFKKEDPTLCDTYRPISLLRVGYKIFSTIILERLRNGRAQKHIWPTQFGFQPNYGTTDALFVAR